MRKCCFMALKKLSICQRVLLESPYNNSLTESIIRNKFNCMLLSFCSACCLL